MNILKFCPGYAQIIWKQENESLVIPFILCKKDQYAELFKTYVKSKTSERDAVFLIEFYCSFFGKKRSSIIKKLKGPCFGFCMALLDLHSNKGNLHQENILKKALFYSLFDIVRAKVEFSGCESSSIECEALQRCTAQYFTLACKTLRMSGQEEDVEMIKHTLFNLDHSLVLLRVWSIEEKALVKIVPHSIFLSLNSTNSEFYFYDSLMDSKIISNTLDSFIDLFIDYIKKVNSSYLKNNIIWRFASTLLNK
jgi:hypothetical protein